MNNRYPCKPIAILLCLVAIAVNACSSAGRVDTSQSRSAGSDKLIRSLSPEIEALYLAWHELDKIHKDIKFLERGFIFDPNDRQLGYIQKAALYLQDAAVRTHHRWEQLSVLHYIRPEMMRDYLTISVSGLTSTMDEIDYNDMFIDIYATFIAHDAVKNDLKRAREQMEKTRTLLDQIRQRLIPLANATIPAIDV
jgi:hypothetical protein